MKKKILAIGLSLVLTLGLAGCSSAKNNDRAENYAPTAITNSVQSYNYKTTSESVASDESSRYFDLAVTASVEENFGGYNQESEID